MYSTRFAVYVNDFIRRSIMELTMLGTGNALVTKCYNTCFVIKEGSEYLLVDGGGGNGILTQLKNAGIDWKDIRSIFLTHKHIDHLFGIIWMIRMISQNMAKDKYEGDVNVYAHGELLQIICGISAAVLQPKQLQFLGGRIHLNPIEDEWECEIIGHDFTFFDIQSTKARQHGFTMRLDGNEKLACCGDEPLSEECQKYANNCKWLLHEAFCLYSEAAIFKPYEKHHSTVRDACELAEKLSVRNLLLYHTEDSHIEDRKAIYREEGRMYYNGNLYIPDDLETVTL